MDYFQQEAHTRKELQQLLHVHKVTCSAQGCPQSIAWADSTIPAKEMGVDWRRDLCQDAAQPTQSWLQGQGCIFLCQEGASWQLQISFPQCLQRWVQKFIKGDQEDGEDFVLWTKVLWLFVCHGRNVPRPLAARFGGEVSRPNLEKKLIIIVTCVEKGCTEVGWVGEKEVCMFLGRNREFFHRKGDQALKGAAQGGVQGMWHSVLCFNWQGGV